MPFTDDSFLHLFDWEKDPQRQEKIVNSRLESEFDGFDTGLSALAARVTVVEDESVVGGSTGNVDNSALRADGTGGATLQNSPLIIADTTGDLSRDGNGGIDIQGTNTNDNAAAGQIGEYISSTVASGSAVSISPTNTTINVTSISLTAGDWDVTGTVFYSISVGTQATRGAVATTSATIPAYSSGALGAFWNNDKGDVNGVAYSTGPVRLSLSGTTTVYLAAAAQFSSGTVSAFGSIGARRVR